MAMTFSWANSLTPPGANPILVEVYRGGNVESRHRGRVIIVDTGGQPLARLGDVEAMIFPRSAMKAIQALPLLETGAFAAAGLGMEELALACASHNGEQTHTEKVSAWLTRIGLSPGALECGAHSLSDALSAAGLIRNGQVPSSVHNNCSGKHAGMLTTARHLGEPLVGYVDPEHPVQRRIAAVLADLAEVDIDTAPCGIDGCSVPNWGLSLRAFACAMARFLDPSGLNPARAGAMRLITGAWATNPYLIAGRDRFDTSVMMLFPGQVLSKVGAEGVRVMLLPHLGLVVALKIDDGAVRAADVAAAALLQRLGVGEGAIWQTAAAHQLLFPELTNHNGRKVGELAPAKFLS